MSIVWSLVEVLKSNVNSYELGQVKTKTILEKQTRELCAQRMVELQAKFPYRSYMMRKHS